MKTEPLAASIAGGADALGQSLSTEQVEKLSFLLCELHRWGQKVNLTGILDLRKMVAAHVLDSLAVRSFIEGSNVIDVGTGAGFPGLPLAIVEPELEFSLLDSNRKKISFVNHVIGQLGISNATAVKARAQDYAPGTRFATVIARALASTPKLLQLAGHLVKEDGVLLALKGKHPAAELDAIHHLPGWDYSVTELTVPGLESHARHVICLRKVAVA